tara:strand:- start:474 stop:677 length:204 start_codon:yes stop_codon:yes gene_type:complete
MHGRTELLVKGKLEQHDWSERLLSGFGVAIKRMTNDVRLQILADFFFDILEEEEEGVYYLQCAFALY